MRFAANKVRCERSLQSLKIQCQINRAADQIHSKDPMIFTVNGKRVFVLYRPISLFLARVVFPLVFSSRPAAQTTNVQDLIAHFQSADIRQHRKTKPFMEHEN